MKTLGKIQIKADKIMKNDELMTVKGGYSCTCTCTDGYHMAATSGDECESNCSAYGQHGVWRCC